MTAFDRVAIVDWSGGNDTGPRPRRDAIWMAEGTGAPVYLRNRGLAFEALSALIAGALSRGERLLIGFDFPFGYPAGFAAALTGRDDPLSTWRWLADRIEDTPRGNNRFQVAAAMNRLLGQGRGPFWGIAGRLRPPGLAPNKAGYANPFSERRHCETLARGSFTCWQLAYAGAVGSQVLMGLPVLDRLRHRFAGAVAVWPFEPLDRPVAFVEIWPTLVDRVVRADTVHGIRDAAQVAVLARGLHRLAPARLSAMLAATGPGADKEGWILGLGHEEELIAACR